MKKKVRDITVDGIKYTWLAKRDYYEIFKDRKSWIYVEDDGVITPKMIAEKIKQKLSEES